MILALILLAQGIAGYGSIQLPPPPQQVTAGHRDFVSVKDFGATGDGVTDDTAAAQAATTALGANGLMVAPGTLLRTDNYGNNAMLHLIRTDSLSPLSGAGILNAYLYPMLRLDYLAQGGGVTGADTGILVYMPGIKGKTLTSLTGAVTGSVSAQSVPVTDSSVFIVGDVANVDINQGSLISENVTITAIPDSTHVTGVFTKNHASGAKLFVGGKGDKIGIGCAMGDAATGNTNSFYCENLNVTAVGIGELAVVGSEIDVTNSTGAPPGAFVGDVAPFIQGLSLVNAGNNDATSAIGIGTSKAATRFLNGISIEAAKNYGIAITQGPGGAPTTGIGIQGAVTNGIAIGSNQTPATSPLSTLQDPTVGLLLTSRGTAGSISSNLIRWQELIASVSHTMDAQLTSSQLRWLYDGTWQGAAVNSDGSVQTQAKFQVRNASNTVIADWTNSAGTAILKNQIYTSASANPAATGTFRLASVDTLQIRNSAANADLNVLSKTSGDVTVVGDAQGVQAKSVRSGVSGNTDLGGALTASAGTASYSFTQTYTSAPICVCSDTTATVSGCNVTAASTTTVTFKVAATDTLNYICVGRN